MIYLSAFSHHRAFESLLTAAYVKNVLMGEDASASITRARFTGNPISNIIIGSDNGLVLTRQQAINDCWFADIYVSLGLNEYLGC